MAWKGLTLTMDGQSVLNNAQISNRMNIKSIVVGDGNAPEDFRTLKNLVNQLFEITDLKIEMSDEQCTLTADFPKVNYDYTFREIGVIVTTDDGERLYVYDNCGADAQRIVSSMGVETTRKRIRLSLAISDVADITVSNPSILYVAYDDYEKNMARMDETIKSKVDKESGKGLSANDYTDQDKVKLQGIEEGANNYTHPDTHPSTMIDQDAEHRFVSDLEKQEWGGAYAQATAYTDQKIADLINGAPSTLDTLGEIANAMSNSEDVVAALDAAIGTKANQAEMESLLGTKLDKTGDSKDNTITFESGDSSAPTGWTDVGLIASGEKHSSLWNKVSLFAKNVRYLWKLLGNTSLSGIGDGTVTGAISALNTGLGKVGQQIFVGTSAKTIPPQTDVEIGSITLPSGFWIIYISIWYGPYFKSLRINGFKILNEDHKPEMIAFYNGPGATLPLIAYSWEASNIEIDNGSIMAFRLK